MKIRSLSIPDYNILRDFTIDFSSNLSVIIGENGSGKSSILECLAYIFGHLHKYFVLDDKTAGFIDGYRILYEINGFEVFIESHYVSSPTNTFQPIIRINEEELSILQIKKRYGSFEVFLPSKVILSYSGVTEHLKELNKHFEDKFINRIIRINNPYSLTPLYLPTDNPFIYVKKEYVSFILLALFVLDSDPAKELLQTVGIDINGCKTRITLKKPYWAKAPSNRGDANALWGMTGKIASDFIKGLDVVGIRLDDPTNDANLVSFDFYGALMIHDLFSTYYNLQADQVISFMDAILCDDLLESVNIVWGDGLTVDRLSEGEKQLILSIGLSLVLNNKNLLFLLDEPDVALHPKWQHSFISSMKKGLDSDSMAIITTHSPILISNLEKSYVRIIHKGKNLDLESLYSFGRDVNSILADYFHVEERNNEGKKLLRDFYEAMTLKKYDEAETLLKTIEETFGPSDISAVKASSLFDDLAD